jgi:predicted Fe-S protein YdhL (DUF1289 family)
MYITPCVSICKILEGKCVGCGRTLEEIAKWRSYSDEERLDIMKRLGYGIRRNRKRNDK